MTNYRRVARRKAEKYHINPRYFKRQIRQESNYDPNARSPAGAEGIAQIMPATARSWGVNPMHPRQALDAAARNMAGYLKAYHGDWAKALTAYNAGPGAVGHSLPAETQNYIHTILAGGPSHQPSPGKLKRQFKRTKPSNVKFTQFGVKTGLKDVVDMKGFEQARRSFVLGSLLSKHGTDSPLFKSGLLTTTMPQVGDFQRQQLTSKVTKRQRNIKIPGGPGGDPKSPDAPRSVRHMLDVAEAWDHAKVHYQWGGGHGPRPAKPGTPVDCSGYVSAVLGVSPRVSGAFASWGKPGRGRFVTVYANSGHVLMSIRNPRNGHVRWYATSHSNPGGGAGQIAPPGRGYLSSFTARHPRGL